MARTSRAPKEADHLADRQGALLGILIAVAAAVWAVLLFRIPLLQNLLGWPWDFTDKPVASWWVLTGAVGGFAVVVAGITGNWLNGWRALLMLMVAGTMLQFGFAALEGRGIDAVRDRMITTGHAEFARLAQEQDDLVTLIANYNRLVAEGRLGTFGPAKPPGTLIFYVLTNHLARLTHPRSDASEDLENLRSTAAWVWPFLSVLVAVPLYLLSRWSGGGPRTGLLACVLYFTVPAANLVTLHADQVVYPLFFVSCLAAGEQARRRDGFFWGLATGLLVYLTIGLSFGLVVVLVFLLAAVQSARRAAAGMVLGLASSITLGYWVGHYDVWARFTSALAYHQAWRPWPESPLAWPYFGSLNLLEFIVWLGVPLAVLWILQVAAGLRVGWSSPRKAVEVLVLPAVVLLLAFGTRTQGEVARLWIFLVPLVCLAAARHLESREKGLAFWLFRVTVVLQLVTVAVIKANMDFG